MVSIFSLPYEIDPDEFWKYWKEIHVPDVKRLNPGPRKYTINRFDHKVGGEEKIWGLVETWWKSENDMRRTFGSSEGKKVANDFWSRITGRCSVMMEEKEIAV